MLSTNNSVTEHVTSSERTIAREGFFLRASQEVRQKFPQLALIVTGGFRSRNGVNAALETGACNAIGLGRPAIKYPDLPNKIMFNNELADEQARFDVEAAPSVGWIGTKIRSAGAGAETVRLQILLSLSHGHHTPASCSNGFIWVMEANNRRQCRNTGQIFSRGSRKIKDTSGVHRTGSAVCIIAVSLSKLSSGGSLDVPQGGRLRR